MNEDQRSSASILGEIVNRAIPVNATPPADYVTRNEFDNRIQLVESKIEQAILRTKLWIVTGVIAIVMAFGGGVFTILQRIDRISEQLPQLAKVQEGRRDWIMRKEQQDASQDSALKRLAPDYEAPPREVPPQ